MVKIEYFYKLTQGEGFLNEFVEYIKFIAQKVLNLPYRITRRSKIKKYYKSHEKIRLQFGSGIIIINGFLNTNLYVKVPIDITKKLPFPNDSIDIIFSNHVIEHIYNRQFKKYLRESLRILKKGGIQIITTPSLKKIVDAIYYDNEKKNILLFESHLEMAQKIKIFGGGKLDPATYLNYVTHIYYGHRFLYDFEAIYKLAKMAGYSNITEISVREIPDKSIKEIYLIKEHEIPWSIETGIYLLEK